jgi:hypothetical protein
LGKILEEEPDAFARALTAKLLTYALGRGLDVSDHRVVRTIARKVAADDYRFSSLVTEIVQSVPFQMRQGAVIPMIVTGKHLPRRTFLKGLGAAVALPMLDAMTPAFAAPALKQTPTRLAFTYIPNGVTLEAWTPAAGGRDFEFTRILKPLEGTARAHAGHHRPGAAERERPGRRRRRSRARRGLLPDRRPPAQDGGRRHPGRASRSIRSPLARSAATRGTPRSSSAATSRARSATATPGYSCAYTNSLSWRSPTSPMPPETNPRLAFERLFGGIDAGLDPATRAIRRRERRSILDIVAERTKALVGSLGPSDRRKMDEYLTSVREIERRIEIAERDTREVTPDFEMPSGVPVLFADYASLMFDMQAIAFQADLTRVSTLMLGREGSLPHVSRDRRARSASPAHPPPRQPGVDREGDEGERAAHGAVREVHREARRHARWRRHAARSLHRRLRQRHRRRQQAHPRGSARRRRRPRRRPARAAVTWSTDEHADDQLLPDDARSDWRQEETIGDSTGRVEHI